MEQSEKNAKKLCQRCHNIKVVALTTTCLSMWKTCPTSDPRSLSPTLIPSASSQSHQTSLLGAVAVSRQVPTLLSRQDNPENVQEVSWQLEECQQVDSIMVEANEYDAITEEWDKYNAIIEVLDQLLGVYCWSEVSQCVQLFYLWPLASYKRPISSQF